MVSEDGSWVIGPSGNPKQSSISSNRSSFDAVICTGKFHTVMVIKNRLEWGAQTSCVSTASSNYLYRLSLCIELRQQDEGGFFIKKISGYIMPNGPCSRVIAAVAPILVETAIRRDMTWLLTPWFTALSSGRW